MPVVPPAPQQKDAADAHPPATQDGAASPGTQVTPSTGTPASPSPERAVIPADAKPEKDATKPLSELAKAPAKHPDVHPHTDDDDDDDDLDSKDAVSGQSPVDAKPAPAADGAGKASAKDGVEKPPAADGVKAPAADGVEKPPAAGGVEKPPAADGVEKPPATDGAGKAAAADSASDPPAAAGGVQNPPAAGAEPAPKEGAKEAEKFNDQGLEEPTAPPPGVTRGPTPPSKADPKPPSKADSKPPSKVKAKPQPDAPPPTTQEIQDALDRIYANANKDDDARRLANGHDTELQIPYRALGIVLLVFVAFFLGVRWKRRPRYGGYAQVSVVEVREELPVAVKPRHYRD